MLELREYTREELTSIHNTDNLQAIKNKVKRQGYVFEDIGRGKSYKMKIVSMPNAEAAFRLYCIENLGFAAQKDFKPIKVFLELMLQDDEFVNLQQDEQLAILSDYGAAISKPTLISYYEIIKNKLEWFANVDYIYYVYYSDAKTEGNKYISEELYKKAWKEHHIYLNSKYTKEEQRKLKYYIKYADFFTNKELYGIPKKRPKMTLNGFYKQQYDELEKLIERLNNE